MVLYFIRLIEVCGRKQEVNNGINNNNYGLDAILRFLRREYSLPESLKLGLRLQGPVFIKKAAIFLLAAHLIHFKYNKRTGFFLVQLV